jgi:hypothetical protein
MFVAKIPLWAGMVAHSCNPVIQRLRQEEHEIENILGCTGRH